MVIQDVFDNILILATLLSLITSALTQVLKKPLKVSDNFVPLLAVAIGILLGIGASPITDAGFEFRIWAGAIAGLSATGLYETGKDRSNKKE